VVLTEDLPNIGNSGELVKVRPGFARNFLIPRGLAAIATKDNVAKVEHEKRLAAARAIKLRKSAQAIADKLGEITLRISCTVGEGDKLYGSVTSRDVEDALAEKGLEIDRRKIVMEPPSKWPPAWTPW